MDRRSTDDVAVDDADVDVGLGVGVDVDDNDDSIFGRFPISVPTLRRRDDFLSQLYPNDCCLND